MSHKIVIGAAGRRLYLVEWFREAFKNLGISGEVIVAEADATSAAYSAGDSAWLLPTMHHPAYADELLGLVQQERPLLYVSLNDYELMRLHSEDGLANTMRDLGTWVPGVSTEWQRLCADKFLLWRALSRIKLATPKTVLSSDGDSLNALSESCPELIVKHRFGSGSSGLRISNASRLTDDIESSISDLPNFARHDRDMIIVQQRIHGEEYGVDIIGSLENPGKHEATMARRKLRMRAGETDKATTVAAVDFQSLGNAITNAASVSGLVDADVIVTSSSERFIIDLNPRFGGGYPFSHLAGADVPLFYLAQRLGMPISNRWAAYQAGVTSAKFEAVRVTSWE